MDTLDQHLPTVVKQVCSFARSLDTDFIFHSTCFTTSYDNEVISGPSQLAQLVRALAWDAKVLGSISTYKKQAVNA